MTPSSGNGAPLVLTVKVPLLPATKAAVAGLVKAGFAWTTTVSVCMASSPTPFAAVRSTVTDPGAPVGVPEIVAVPSPSSSNESPSGRSRTRVMSASGKPFVVTVKEPASSRTKIASSALVIVGDSLTVSVNVWSLEPTEFVALKVTVLTPPGASGMPARVPVPFGPSAKVTPGGRAPTTASSAVGKPAVVTANDPGVPTVKVVLATLVKVGRSRTSSVKGWVALPTRLVAVSRSAVLPLVVGVPEKVAVPFPLSVNVIPGGGVPCSVMAAGGSPTVVTVKDPAWPTSKVVEAALVNDGLSWTVRVKVCWALPTVLVAVRPRL